MKSTWPATLCLEVEEVYGYPCIRLEGEGEGEGARTLGNVFSELIRQGQVKILLDTRRVRFLDPQCSEALEISVRRLEEEGGVIVIIDESLPVERTLKLLGVEQFGHVAQTVKQAVAYLDWHE